MRSGYADRWNEAPSNNKNQIFMNILSLVVGLATKGKFLMSEMK